MEANKHASHATPSRFDTPTYDDDRQSELNSRLLDAIETQNNEELARLLQEGANSNATCRFDHDIFAIHVAALSNESAVRLLLQAGADKHRVDVYGRMPLHLAACNGAVGPTAVLLGLNQELQEKLILGITPDREAEVTALRPTLRHVANMPVALAPHQHEIEGSWMDSRYHHRHHFFHQFPWYKPGWTPLHAASYTASRDCVRLLLAAGADPNLKDANGRTPLDVAGSACFQEQEHNAVSVDDFEKTVKILLGVGSEIKTTAAKMLFNSVLHTAVKMGSLEALPLLLDAGAPITHLRLYSQGETCTPLHICVKLRLVEHLQILAKYRYRDLKYRAIDVTDSSGSTVLHLAAIEAWEPGVRIALEAGVDVTLTNYRGDSAIHLAAQAGNLDILKEIICASKGKQDVLMQKNDRGETPFSRAIYSGNMEIILFMLSHDKNLLFHKLSTKTNLVPLEYAVVHNFKDLFDYIIKQRRLNNNEIIRLINIIAKYNRTKYLSIFLNLCTNYDLLNYDYNYVKHNLLHKGYSLHTAIIHGSRDMVLTLIKERGDLSQINESGQTALSLIMYHITRPTEFIEDIFDLYIYSNDRNIYDSDCKITVDYSVLMPRYNIKNNRYYDLKAKQMDVLQALVETGNRNGQRRLLAHPLVESFLHLKWKKLSKYIYFIISIYALFLMSINAYLVSVFYHRDNRIRETDIPLGYCPTIWKCCIFVTASLVCILELFLWDLKKLWIQDITTWVKFCSISLGTVMPIIISMESPDDVWRRDLASFTVILTWTNMMIYFSWTPTCGYYMQMFGKVSYKILKILLSLSFPVLCFAIIFMIQFHTDKPFEGPLAAFMKTTVMMTSEFDYEDLFNDESSALLHLIFLLFLVFIAIVLMNLMIAVAVNDLQSLTMDGNLRRLEKQVKCLCMLESFFSKKRVGWLLKLINTEPRTFWAIDSDIKVIQPTKNVWYPFDGRMRKVITTKAQNLTDMRQKKAEDIESKTKLDKILKAVAMKSKDENAANPYKVGGILGCEEKNKNLNELIQNIVDKTLESVSIKRKCIECRILQDECDNYRNTLP